MWVRIYCRYDEHQCNDKYEGYRIKENYLRHLPPATLSLRRGRNHLVAADASQALTDSLAWDTEPRIVLDIPYKDQVDPLSICFDGVLQRLVELTKHEGTRQTKTLAAECLHALVVYMVGQR